jgi:hypothetical protein
LQLLLRSGTGYKQPTHKRTVFCNSICVGFQFSALSKIGTFLISDRAANSFQRGALTIDSSVRELRGMAIVTRRKVTPFAFHRGLHGLLEEGR